MSVQTPDAKVALRNFLEADPNIQEIIGSPPPHRVVLDLADVKGPGHWLVLTRAGGQWDVDVPVSRPMLYMAAYGVTRWEALRLMNAACEALGIPDPAYIPQIRDAGVIISDVSPQANWTEDTDDRVVQGHSLPLVLQPIQLVVHRE